MNQKWLDTDKFTSDLNKFPFSISMLSWGLNEEENIIEFLSKSKKLMDSLNVTYEHILIDDGSTDKTYELANEFKWQYPQLRIIRNRKNLGSGWNTRIAVEAAQNDVLFWQTVDWSYDISEIGSYLQYLRTFDVVQGVRIKDVKPEYGQIIDRLPLIRDIRVSKRSDNLRKAIISVTNYLLIRLLFRLPLLDFQNVTIYPRRLAQSLNLEATSAFINPEMLIKAYSAGAHIKQVPISFIARTKGEAKGTRLPVIVRSISEIFKYWILWNFIRRPSLKSTSGFIERKIN